MQTEGRLIALEARLEALSAREAIRACLYRYCRGIDRCDEAALRSSYWPDATDRHGPYSGSASGFIDWALAKLKEGGRVIHTIGNIAIELRGAEAAVESYFQAFQTDTDAQGKLRETFLCGRYIDRFERRDGRWAIAHRVCLNEKIGYFVEAELSPEWAQAAVSTGPASRDKRDLSYVRPLSSGKL